MSVFDSHFLAYCGVAALLVLSPGATMVVVAEAAIDEGRRAALWTVAGIGSANATMALAAAFGLAAVVHRVPVVLEVITIVGAVYLAWLGLRALLRARHEPPLAGGARAPHRQASSSHSSSLARFGRGLLTNYSNPSVILFYAVLVPQFIPPGASFLARYLLLGGIHVAMSVLWQGAVGISVGLFAERMVEPGIRRVMDLAMGVALVAFAVKIAV